MNTTTPKTHALLFIIACCLIAFSSCSKHPSPPHPPAKAPNIVFILVDDQGWAGTSVQMDPAVTGSNNSFFRTPNLEALAHSGIIFANGFAPHCNCSPSRASILTGKSPAKIGMTDIIGRSKSEYFHGNQYNPPAVLPNLPLSNIILPKWITSHRPEYRTALFGKWHVSQDGGPVTYGFDDAGDTVNFHNAPFNEDPKETFSITRDGLSWMKTQVQQQHPFYLQLCYHAVHYPLETRQSTYNQVNGWPDAGLYNNEIKMMAAMTLDLDSAVGLVMKQLKDLGIEDNTYIIYTSDNGFKPTSSPTNLNGPLHGWKATLWQGGIRVPFMVAGPGIPSGRSNATVIGYDIFPTVCDWLSIPSLPSGVEGGSMATVLKTGGGGEVQRPNDFLVFDFPHYKFPFGSQPSAAIIKGDRKLIKFYEGNVLRYYNWKTDISETKDMSVSDPEGALQMENLLDNYLQAVDAAQPVKNEKYDPATDPGKKFWDVKKKLMDTSYFVLNN